MIGTLPKALSDSRPFRPATQPFLRRAILEELWMRMRTLVAWIWTGLLLVACWIPGRWLHGDESRMHLGISNLDKVVHGTLFAGFGLLWGRALGTRGRTARVVAVGLLLAVVTELGQATPVIARDADPLDALADAAGLFLGLGAARLLQTEDAGPESANG